MKIPNNKLLLLKLEDLELSEGCKVYFKGEGICTLTNFIDAGWAEQKRKDHFNVRFFNEVVQLLEKNKLLYLMEGK